jgi:cytochrome c peroxidase
MLVGTGKPFQVPSLKGVGARAPFMHDGCAKTLAERFQAPCGGGDQHGVTSHLSPAAIADLVAYLESL